MRHCYKKTQNNFNEIPNDYKGMQYEHIETQHNKQDKRSDT